MAVPTLAASSIIFFGSDSAQGVGNCTADGGKTLSKKGLCWSTSENPTINDNKTEITGTAIGLFAGSLTGLVAGTLYYVRAYATNDDGTGYGTQTSFTTLAIETPSLQNVTFGFKENGTPIPKKPNLQNVTFEFRKELPIPQKPNLQNVTFAWSDPMDVIPEPPKLKAVYFSWEMPYFEKPCGYGNAILFGSGI